MITAKEARANMPSTNISSVNIERILSSIEKEIKTASELDKDYIVFSWSENNIKKTNFEAYMHIVQTLSKNGYNVKMVSSSHYYENGAILIRW